MAEIHVTPTWHLHLARAGHDQSERRCGVLPALFGWDLNGNRWAPTARIRCSCCAARKWPPRSLRPDERQAGIPAHWNMYVTVESADERCREREAARRQGAGAGIRRHERRAHGGASDPSGAVFEVWEPRLHIGAKDGRTSGSLLEQPRRATRRRPRRSTRSCSDGRRKTAPPTPAGCGVRRVQRQGWASGHQVPPRTHVDGRPENRPDRCSAGVAGRAIRLGEGSPAHAGSLGGPRVEIGPAAVSLGERPLQLLETCERSGDRLAAFLVERGGGHGRFHLTMLALE